VGVNVRNREELPELLSHLNAANIATVDLSDNEMAKLHIRHLVGGRAPQAGDELLYRFEFPERPGALMDFLHALGQQRNISLFHYRNHGADTARVLVGLQISVHDKAAFHATLNQMHYVWTEETANPAYRLFLGA